MGVIKRQSIKQSLVNYIAVAIGANSIIFIYPQERAIYGLARFIIDTPMMIASFVMLGLSGVSMRFFPHIHKDTNKAGFLLFLLLGVLLGSILFTGLAFLLKEQIYKYYIDKPELFLRYLLYLVPIAISIEDLFSIIPEKKGFSPGISIVIRSLVVGLICIGCVYRLKISRDINEMIGRVLRRRRC